MNTDHAEPLGIPALSLAVVARFLNEYSSGILVVNESGVIVSANHEIERIFGYKTNELKNRSFCSLITASQSQQLLTAFKSVASGSDTIYAGKTFEAKGKRRNGNLQAIEIGFNIIREAEQQLNIIQITDITQRVVLQQQLYKKTITDPLTGMHNRRYFDERLSQEFNRAARYRRPFSVLIMDVDGFKQANDKHGHAFGDELLVKSSAIFNRFLRHEDTAYRYGGDEFAMLLPETSKEGALEVADRLRETFATENNLQDKRIKLSLSIGIACYPDDGSTQKTLIGAADSRMYQSKGNGGNMITAYDNDPFLSRETGSLIRSLSYLNHLIEKNRGLGSRYNGTVHSQNTRTLSIELGQALALDSDKIFILEQASMLHDVGCLYIPSSTLNKDTALTQSEWEEVKRHTIIGEQIIDVIAPKHERDIHQLKIIAGQHHEKIDGSGYPRGLKGNEIALEAKILAVADAFVAMTNKRPYRAALTKQMALGELKQLAGVHYEAQVVDALVNLETNTA